MNPENTLGHQFPPQGWQQPSMHPPPPQGASNGNYQQQLAGGMSAMTINPAKQNMPQPPPPQSGAPTRGADFGQPPPPQQQPQMGRPNMPPSTNGMGGNIAHNNNMNMSNNNISPPGSFPQMGTNAPPQQHIPPTQNMPGGPSISQQQQQQHQQPQLPLQQMHQNSQNNKNTYPGQQFQQQQQQQPPANANLPPMKESIVPPMPFQNSGPINSNPMVPPMPPTNQHPPQPNMPGYPPVSNANQRQLPPQGGPNKMPGIPGMPPQPQSQQPMYPNQPPISGMPGMQPSPGLPQGGPHQQQQQQQQTPVLPPQPMPQGGGFQQQHHQQQPGFNQQQMGYPPQNNFPPQPNMPLPGGMPPHPGAPQHPGMPPSQPGQYPPRGGYQQPPGMYNAGPGQYPQPSMQQRRLDPDQMPNPIQVMVENQRTSGGLFVTNQPGLLPPLVTTKYVAQDQGNSSPRFVRSSLYSVPATTDLLKQTALPFTIIISPLAKTLDREITPPIVDFGELGPVRCLRCKAYMSPNMQFIDAGRRFMCLMCKANTEVPTEYFQHLDHTGQRIDKYERPELVLGTYEFIATKDYCREGIPPTAPAFIFIIDVSYNNVKSGLVHLLCREIRQIIQHFPIDQGQEKSNMKVGFITYNNTVHFYNLKSTLAQPQMMVVGDVKDMFMPLLDGFLVDPEESAMLIDSLMEQIPAMFGDTKETETILLPAIQAGLEALKASNCAGKLLVFNSSLPIGDAPGKLRNRDDRKVLGTEKEKSILVPQCTSYNDLGRDCVLAGCSVDLFIFNNSYVDVATVGQVSRLSGGEVYKYTYFQADIDGERLVEDIIKNVSRPIAFDAVMRVRTSAGVRPTDFYGHFFMSNTTDMELASIDCDKSVAIEIKHDDKLSPEENVYVQIALLYTSCGGQRRLRIMNLALKTTMQIADVFKSCDLDAIILFFAKQSMFKLMDLSPKTVKDNLIHRSAQVLACYRKNCTSPTSAGQLILPECLKLLPLYISCMIKNDAFSGGSDMTCDDRSYVIQFVLSMDLPMSVFYFYPRLIPIHNVEMEETDIPLPIRCTHEKMTEDGAYILENGIHMFLWLGIALSSEFVQSLFGVQCTQQVNPDQFALPISDSPISKRIRQIVESIKIERTRCMRLTVVKQGDKMENVFRHFLVEDRGTDGTASYVDFLCHMHKEIKDLLS